LSAGPSLVQMAVVLSVYVVVVIAVGALAARRSARSPEEYFLAGRGLGTFVLFMALFGTNATSFVLVAIPGLAYHEGVGVFGLNAAIVALGTPLTFVVIGVPAWRMGRRLGALTPAELFRKRFDSRAVGIVLFAFFTLYTLPYMVIAVKGAAVTLESITQGAVPTWAGGLGVIVVALVYTSLGGMRATAWTNVLQGSLFLLFMVLVFFLVPRSMGGLGETMRALEEQRPELLRIVPEGKYAPRAWASWGLVISLTVIAFPHMLVRLLAARSQNALKSIVRLYPVALVALWLPAVLLGVWGALEFPGLVGKESDSIYSLMIARHLPSWLGALGFLAVVAAVMSTLDAQLLTLGSMLVRDVVDPFRRGDASQGDVRSARVFTLALAGLVYFLSRVWGQSLFDIASVAFSGYTTLTPMLFLSLWWRRFNAEGAIASILLGNVTLWLGEKGIFETHGFLPVFPALVVAVVSGVVVSLLSRPCEAEITERAMGR